MKPSYLELEGLADPRLDNVDITVRDPLTGVSIALRDGVEIYCAGCRYIVAGVGALPQGPATPTRALTVELPIRSHRLVEFLKEPK